jgi:hypothetical protein
MWLISDQQTHTSVSSDCGLAIEHDSKSRHTKESLSLLLPARQGCGTLELGQHSQACHDLVVPCRHLLL